MVNWKWGVNRQSRAAEISCQSGCEMKKRGKVIVYAYHFCIKKVIDSKSTRGMWLSFIWTCIENFIEEVPVHIICFKCCRVKARRTNYGKTEDCFCSHMSVIGKVTNINLWEKKCNHLNLSETPHICSYWKNTTPFFRGSATIRNGPGQLNWLQ